MSIHANHEAGSMTKFQQWVQRWNIGPGMNDRPPCIHYSGFDGEVGDGWISILDILAESLTALGWQGTLFQVKEKYGTLRFYAEYPYNATREVVEQMHACIRRAEDASEVTCELCGAAGQLYGDHWLTTRCEPCFNKAALRYTKDNP